MILALTPYLRLAIIVRDIQERPSLNYTLEEKLIDIQIVLLCHLSWQEAIASTYAKLVRNLLKVVPKRPAKELESNFF